MPDETKNAAKVKADSLNKKADEARGEALANMRSPPTGPRATPRQRPSSAPVGNEKNPDGASSAEELFAYNNGKEFAPNGIERGPGEPPKLSAMGALVEVLQKDSLNTHKENMEEIKRKRAVDEKEAAAQIKKEKRQKQESDALAAKLGAEAALIASQAEMLQMETEVLRNTGTELKRAEAEKTRSEADVARENAAAANELKRAEAEMIRAEADVARKNAENAGLQLQMQLSMMSRFMQMPLQPQLEPRPANEQGEE